MRNAKSHSNFEKCESGFFYKYFSSNKNKIVILCLIQGVRGAHIGVGGAG